MKTCIKCGILKPLSEYHSHKTTKDKKATACKPCYNKQTRDAKYKSRYGISAETADEMKVSCVVCGTDKNLHIDHCHTTGKIRGVLCTNCNRGLGHFKDNPQLLRLAAEYIEKNG